MADSTAAIPAPSEDRYDQMLLMSVCAVALGYATDVNAGNYSVPGLAALGLAIALAILALLAQPSNRTIGACRRTLPIVLVLGLVLQVGLMLRTLNNDSQIATLLLTIAVIGALQVARLGGLRTLLFVIMLLAFVAATVLAFNRHAHNPGIDVYQFQKLAMSSLMHGRNPYVVKMKNIYGDPHIPFYGPGVVGPDNMLTVGFPYPPLSLLMILPTWWLDQDCRYAIVAAMALSAVLIYAVCPGRRTGVVAALLLLSPRVIYLIDLAWTEPLLLGTFSLLMFCACRWRRGLPYALGLFLSAKQYSVLALPLLLLLETGPGRWRRLGIMLLKAGVVCLVINLPFFLWNPHEFIRALVVFQYLQPFRTDALSFLVSLYSREGVLLTPKPPMWPSLAALALGYVLALWRAPRTPAGFAMGVALILLLFFAFSKQAFCNYYYFVLGTAWWSVAAATTMTRSKGFAPILPIQTLSDAAVPISRA